MLLDEFDEDRTAVIEAGSYINRMDDFPSIAVSCFSHVTFKRMLENYDHEVILELSIANGTIPVYKIQERGIDIAIFNAYVGAAGCIGTLEELAAYGCQRLVIFGTCGVLDKSIEDASIIIPFSALRDEGTSYHYMKASDEIETNQKYMSTVTNLLDQLKIHYSTGKVWTTDAFYRETRLKVKNRKEQGCICVDMECSAVAAWAAFRNIDVFHFFYAADNLDHENWDPRSLGNHKRVEDKDKIADLALDIAAEIVRYDEKKVKL